MRICIWFEVTNAPWGGGNNFLRALASELRAMGHSVDHRPKRSYDLVLVNAFNRGPGKMMHPSHVAQLRRTGRVRLWASAVPSVVWNRMRRDGPAIVHRIDGVAQYVRGFRTRADDIQPAVNLESDFTIFQTGYCQESCEEFGIRPKNWNVIHNAVNPEWFYPNPDRSRTRSGPIRFMTSSWSDNPRKGFAHMAALSLVDGVEVRFLGRWPEAINPERVQLLGAKPSPGVGEALRECDAFFHAATNEPCSNAIVEAMATGLPILYLDSGGNKELVGAHGHPMTGDLEQDVARFAQALPLLSEQVRDHRSQFLIPTAARAYLETFEETLDLVHEAKRP